MGAGSEQGRFKILLLWPESTPKFEVRITDVAQRGHHFELFKFDAQTSDAQVDQFAAHLQERTEESKCERTVYDSVHARLKEFLSAQKDVLPRILANMSKFGAKTLILNIAMNETANRGWGEFTVTLEREGSEPTSEFASLFIVRDFVTSETAAVRDGAGRLYRVDCQKIVGPDDLADAFRSLDTILAHDVKVIEEKRAAESQSPAAATGTGQASDERHQVPGLWRDRVAHTQIMANNAAIVRNQNIRQLSLSLKELRDIQIP